MNREQAKAMLPLIRAFAEGKEIQYKNRYEVWIDVASPAFDGSIENYRIKPEETWDWVVYGTYSGQGFHKEAIFIVLEKHTKSDVDAKIKQMRKDYTNWENFHYARVEGSKRD